MTVIQDFDAYSQNFINIKLFNKVLDKFKEWLVSD